MQTIDADDFEKRVEMKAYELFVKSGFKNGDDWKDWFEAQRVVEAEIDHVDRDCIRSEILYKASHRPDPLPSNIEIKK